MRKPVLLLFHSSGKRCFNFF